jgi:hypothetical protein
MAHESIARNPFMLMMHPEVVLAAIERSEHLSQLNRHLCRPLDRNTPLVPNADGVQPTSADASDGDDGARA